MRSHLPESLDSNPLFAELQKIAMSDAGEAPVDDEPMNPDFGPQGTLKEAEEEREKSQKEKDDELDQKKEQAKEDQMKGYEQLGDDEKTAALVEFGTLARLIGFSQGEDADADLQKIASDILRAALSSEEGYVEQLTKVAEELFSTPGNLEQLRSEEGHQFVVEKLSSYFNSDEMEKVAAEDSGSFLNKVKTGVNNFIYAVTNLNQIKGQLDQANDMVEKAKGDFMNATQTFPGQPQEAEAFQNLDQATSKADGLAGLARQGKIGRGLAGAAAVGGALYGGKKVYDATHDDKADKKASDEDKWLLSKEAGGTLNAEYPTRTGGMAKMSKTLVRDFLKIAGAAALIEMANNREAFPAEINKKASAMFDEIGRLGRADMNEAFVKVAQQNYTEQQLHEIVAGLHTEELLDKVAVFIEAADMPMNELIKTAGDDSMGARSVGHALADAASNITATIDQAKEKAEGAGREYIGEVNSAASDKATGFKDVGGSKDNGSGTGRAGGGLVANVSGLAGYSVLNNPEAHDVGKTAQALEEAVFAKQAAIEVYQRADAFIKKHARG